MKSPLYLTKKLARWSTTSCALALAYQPSVSKINKQKNKCQRFAYLVVVPTVHRYSTGFYKFDTCQVSALICRYLD